jgi:hypothetical protein
MITTTLERGTRDAVEKALEKVLGPLPSLPWLAETLIGITIAYGLRIEEQLLSWIRYSAPGKEWSPEEYRRWCLRYVDLAIRLAHEHAAFEKPQQQICTHCHKAIAQRSKSGEWWCPDCGLTPSR